MAQRNEIRKCLLLRFAPRLWPGLLVAAALFTTAQLVSSPHYRLLALLVAIIVCVATALVAWVTHYPTHQCAFFLLVITSIVLLLAAEVAFKAIDYNRPDGQAIDF